MYSHVFYNKFMGSSSHWLHIEATNKTKMFPTLITILERGMYIYMYISQLKVYSYINSVVCLHQHINESIPFQVLMGD